MPYISFLQTHSSMNPKAAVSVGPMPYVEAREFVNKLGLGEAKDPYQYAFQKMGINRSQAGWQETMLADAQAVRSVLQANYQQGTDMMAVMNSWLRRSYESLKEVPLFDELAQNAKNMFQVWEDVAKADLETLFCGIYQIRPYDWKMIGVSALQRKESELHRVIPPVYDFGENLVPDAALMRAVNGQVFQAVTNAWTVKRDVLDGASAQDQRLIMDWPVDEPGGLTMSLMRMYGGRAVPVEGQASKTIIEFVLPKD